MGRVYTPEAVSRGEVPVPGAHERAGRYLLGTFSGSNLDLGGEPAEIMESGAIFGSTAFRKSDIRSDVDGVFLYAPWVTEAEARAVFNEVIARAEETFKVHVEARLHNTSEVPKLMGTAICPMFAEHVDEACRLKDPSWNFNDPAKDMRPAFFAPEDLESRIRSGYGNFLHKTKQFDRALDEYGGLTTDRTIPNLQRALELPNATARKLLPITVEPGETLPHITDKSANVARIAQKIVRYCMGDPEQVVRSYQALRAMNSDYDDQLKATLEGKLTTREYEYWLDEKYEPAVTHAATLAFAALDITRARFETVTGTSSIVLDEDPRFESFDHY